MSTDNIVKLVTHGSVVRNHVGFLDYITVPKGLRIFIAEKKNRSLAIGQLVKMFNSVSSVNQDTIKYIDNMVVSIDDSCYRFKQFSDGDEIYNINMRFSDSSGFHNMNNVMGSYAIGSTMSYTMDSINVSAPQNPFLTLLSNELKRVKLNKSVITLKDIINFYNNYSSNGVESTLIIFNCMTEVCTKDKYNTPEQMDLFLKTMALKEKKLPYINVNVLNSKEINDVMGNVDTMSNLSRSLYECFDIDPATLPISPEDIGIVLTPIIDNSMIIGTAFANPTVSNYITEQFLQQSGTTSIIYNGITYNINDCSYIHTVCVTYSFRGNGFCTPLVQKMLSTISITGGHKTPAPVILIVRTDNESAVKCYKRAGFVFVDNVIIQHAGTDHFIMIGMTTPR
jgi:hypothetical protein